MQSGDSNLILNAPGAGVYYVAMSADAPRPRRKTLIVEDDPSLLDALHRAFVEAGEDVVVCGTFEDARHALRTSAFDAMITDVRLGAFNGLQLALLAHDTHPDIRLVVFSGFDDPVIRMEAERVGAAYLVKPVASQTLIELVRQPASRERDADKT